MKKVGIALLGLGTVGSGTYRILTEMHEDFKRINGIDLEIRHILEKNPAPVRALGIDPAIVSTDIQNVINDPEISIVAEFFGGIEPARTFLLAALRAGKSIVTANKELFSKHWTELEAAAKQGGAGLYFEASCVGGVPIIRTLCEGMQGNHIRTLMGIVNGTTNYILTRMADEGLEYDAVLREAQRLGYAEANPSADVDGFDSTYKLSILSTLAFYKKVPISKITREGISGISKIDIEMGKQFGYTLKLLAIGKQVNGKIEARVHPAFIPNAHPLASVKGSFNAVLIQGDHVGDIMLYGRGAGDLPTGSAIVSDIIYCAQQTEHKYLPFDQTVVREEDFADDFVSQYYLRMTVQDRHGVLKEISGVFADNHVSINSMQQRSDEGKASLIFFIHETRESSLKKAVEGIRALHDIVESVDAIIRVC